MRQAVRATLRLRRLHSTLLLHALSPKLPQGTAAFPAYSLVRWAIAGARPQEPATLFEQAERLIARLTLDERRRLIERLLDDEFAQQGRQEAPELPLEQTALAIRKNERARLRRVLRVYPRHVARGAAERAYRRIVTKGEATEAELLAGAMRYAAAQDGKDPTYVKRPTTWLNAKCWLDEPAPAAVRPRRYLDSIRAGLAVHLDEEGT